ncbi:hypothetical protein WMY93_012263 [Mugilogobius chulae]|uniref:Uncharacterized protein n=1 Tax=Mugilogobius chulae TaxID=88201 RepID=A0AAW0P8G1_9GOBI
MAHRKTESLFASIVVFKMVKAVQSARARMTGDEEEIPTAYGTRSLYAPLPPLSVRVYESSPGWEPLIQTMLRAERPQLLGDTQSSLYPSRCPTMTEQHWPNSLQDTWHRLELLVLPDAGACQATAAGAPLITPPPKTSPLPQHYPRVTPQPRQATRGYGLLNTTIVLVRVS